MNITKIIIEIFLVVLVITLILFDKKKINIIKKSFKYNYVKLYLFATIIFYIFINYGINNNNLNLLTIDLNEHQRLKKFHIKHYLD